MMSEHETLAWDVPVSESSMHADQPASRTHVYDSVFVVLTMGLLLIPLVGLLWYSPSLSSMNDVSVDRFPVLYTQQGFNWHALSELGTYFESRYAFRDQALIAHARVHSFIGMSSTDQVIKGRNGWLFYSDTLDDYLGRSMMSKRVAFNIAHNLRLTQDYVESHGARFAVMIAPNKNALYGQHMPLRYSRISHTSSIDVLVPYLETQQIDYIDVLKPLRAAIEQDTYDSITSPDARVYFKRDTHWNNRGAAIAHDALLSQMGKEFSSLIDAPFSVEATHRGDLDVMLNLSAAILEDDYHFQQEPTFKAISIGTGLETTMATFNADLLDVEDDLIRTTNSQRDDALLMYRDSFGNALVPLLADQFGNAQFSKYIPYSIEYDMLTGDYNYVVIERAQRSISLFQENPPVFEGPRIARISGLQIHSDGEAPSDTKTAVSMDGDYLVIDGLLDERFEKYQQVEISIAIGAGADEQVYRPFYVSATRAGVPSAYGFRLFVKQSSLADDIENFRVIVEVTDEGAWQVPFVDVVGQISKG